MTKIVMDTLGKLADRGYQFNLWCCTCRSGRLVSCESMRQRLGSDHSHYVVGKFRCKDCNGKDIEVRVSPPTDPYWHLKEAEKNGTRLR
jgi:hypothetical protein